jgi:predicted nucleotidyltransferase
MAGDEFEIMIERGEDMRASGETTSTSGADRPTMLDRITQHREAILKIAERYGACDVRVFGSVARGESTEASDLDILVRYRPGTSLWDMGGLWTALHELLGVDIDISDEATLREELRDEVLRQARPI